MPKLKKSALQRFQERVEKRIKDETLYLGKETTLYFDFDKYINLSNGCTDRQYRNVKYYGDHVRYFKKKVKFLKLLNKCVISFIEDCGFSFVGFSYYLSGKLDFNKTEISHDEIFESLKKFKFKDKIESVTFRDKKGKRFSINIKYEV